MVRDVSIMILECTKKLLDYLKRSPTENPELPDELFEWSAGLVTINRRNVIVVTNVATRCFFVLYGVKAKDLKNIDMLIIEGVRTMLRREHIRPEIAEKYLDELGREIICSKNLSKSSSARCSKCCERAGYYADHYVDDDLFQQHLLHSLNKNIYKDANSKNKYCCSFETLRDLFKEKYGENICSCKLLKLEVKIQGLNCRRLLTIPADFDFMVFHKILQNVFEWEDYHMHQFILEKDRYDRPTKIIEPAGFDGDEDLSLFGMKIEKINSAEITVGEVFDEYKKIIYEYDFGDDWIHEITLKGVIDDSPDTAAHCIKAVGEAPVEDCGGVGGFMNLKRILSDPNDPEYEDTVTWLGSSQLHEPDAESIDRRISAYDE